jgi:aquaporin Z
MAAEETVAGIIGRRGRGTSGHGATGNEATPAERSRVGGINSDGNLIGEEISMAGKLIVEAIGTFLLVFTIGQTVKGPDAAALAPLAIGSALMVMVYAGGHYSGGHYNPAVTLGVTLRGKMTWPVALQYMIAQVIGAVIAAGVVYFIKSSIIQAGSPASVPEAKPNEYQMIAQAVGDFLFTFALVYVVLNSATARGTENNSFYGLAIGFTVMVGAFAVGPVSGGAFNPAVGIGLFTMQIVGVNRLIIYLVADFLGGAAAALVFNALDMGGDRRTTV